MFNTKHLGPKSNRRQAHAPTYLSSDNLRENEERSIRSSSHSIKGTGQQALAANVNIESAHRNLAAQDGIVSQQQPQMSARDQVMLEREAKKRAEQDKHERELKAIRENN